MERKPSWYENVSLLQVIVAFMAFALIYLSLDSCATKGTVNKARSDAAAIDNSLIDLENRLRRFDEDDWKDVVPSIREDIQGLRKDVDELLHDLEEVGLEPDHDGPY